MPRKIDVKKGDLSISENVEVIYEATITRFGNSQDRRSKKIRRKTSLRHYHQGLAPRVLSQSRNERKTI
jgi:hypothetical protein